MPNWNELLNQIKAAGSVQDIVRRNALQNLHAVTGRNVIAYYSGWLQKGQLARQGVRFEITDADKQGFMSTVHQMDRSKGLDLLLHTPGGETAATESLVDYLRSMFGNDIRAVVPQLAMSAGTMIALSCNEILMGKHSSLGPIDPQINGIAAHGVIEEFTRASDEIKKDQSKIYVWQPIIAKYSPTLVGECQKAIDWSNEMVQNWLETGMFQGNADATKKAKRVVKELGDHALTKSHARHISLKRAQELELNATVLEDNQALQDAVLTVHHTFILTLSMTPAVRLIENQNGIAYIETVNVSTVAVG